MINLREKYDSGIHYFYRIDNLINKKFYYGIRTCHCLPGQDPYMGSGTHLHRAFRKYGMGNFKKTILRVLPTRQDAKDLERWIVDDEMVKNPMCYNHALGGGDTTVFDGVTIINEDGTYSIISKTEYRKGGYKSSISGKMPVYDKLLCKNVWVESNEYHSNIDRYNTIANRQGRQSVFKTSVAVKDSNGVISFVSRNDIRIKSGELTYIWKGRKHSEGAKNKISLANKKMIGDKNSMYNDSRVWIHNDDNIRKRVKPNEVSNFLSLGNWHLGTGIHTKRSGNFNNLTNNSTINSNYIIPVINKCDTTKSAHNKGFIQMTNGLENTMIHPSKVPEYEAKGYWKGITQFKKHRHNPNSGNKGKRWIHKSDGSRKLINGTDLSLFLNNGEGWIEGYK